MRGPRGPRPSTSTSRCRPGTRALPARRRKISGSDCNLRRCTPSNTGDTEASQLLRKTLMPYGNKRISASLRALRPARPIAPLSEEAARPRAPRTRQQEEGRRVALLAARAGLEKKAEAVEIIDVTGKVDYADYLVLMTG